MSRRLKSFSLTTLTYVLGIAYAFPLLYMFVTSFKREEDVVPPSLTFVPTLENYQGVFAKEFTSHLLNSVSVTVITVILTVICGVVGAYTLVYGNFSKKKADNLYFWFISTIILPPVVVLMPAYIIFKYLNILDTQLGLIILYTGINIPIVIWMVRSFIKEIPYDIIEAAKMDGCSEYRIFWNIVLPLIRTGILSGALLVFVLTWNEFLFAVSLTFVEAKTLPVLMASFMTQQGYFWASLSAISTFVILPPVIMGLIMQKTFVRALSGAVKG